MKITKNVGLIIGTFGTTLCASMGCQAQVTPAPQVVATTAPAQQGASNIDLTPYMGLYSGDWGVMVLRQVGDEVWGSYSHDAGAVRGRVVGSVFTGVWCEDPARSGENDSGLVTFQFHTNASGAPSIDGTWSYGTATPSNPDWDIVLVPGQQNPELEARFADPSKFCR